MSTEDKYRRRWMRALERGGRHPGEERWEELQQKAADIMRQHYAFPAAGIRPGERLLRPVMVPPDYVPVHARELLGIEAAYAQAEAERAVLYDRYQQLARIFADGYAKSTPLNDAQLDELEQLGMQQHGRIAELIVGLVNEVRGYRRACKA